MKLDHSLPSSAKVKNVWSYTSTPIYFHGMILNQLLSYGCSMYGTQHVLFGCS